MDKRDIHGLRGALANKRQPAHDADLARFLEAVRPADHPYRGSDPGCYSRLLELPEFRWPSQGPPASPAVDHLFHCRSLGGFASEIQLKPDPARPLPPRADTTVILDKIRERIEMKAAELRRIWVPLEEIAEGKYHREEDPSERPRRRLISWWTDLPLEQERIVRDVRRLGIPRNWLVSHCVLLRCTVASDTPLRAHVPTALDGFTSEIFLPKDYTSKPTAGQAIDVGADPLDLGGTEFVLGPIAVDSIAVRLIEISRAENDALGADSDDPAFLSRLGNYYSSQL